MKGVMNMTKKIRFHTYDIFNIKDVEKTIRYFNSCHKAALKCGLTVRCITEDECLKLELWGTKSQFVNYYIKTLLKCSYKFDGIKQVIWTLIW